MFRKLHSLFNPSTKDTAMATFRINYGYKGPNNKLRTGSLILNAKDRKEAIANAKKQLDGEMDWHQLQSCKELDSTQTLV